MSKLNFGDIRTIHVSRARIDENGYFLPAVFRVTADGSAIGMDNGYLHALMECFYEILAFCPSLQELHAPLMKSMSFRLATTPPPIPPLTRLKRLVLICPHYDFAESPILYPMAGVYENVERLYLVHGNKRVARQLLGLRLPDLKALYVDGFFGFGSLVKMVQHLSSGAGLRKQGTEPQLLFYCNAIISDELEKPHQRNTTVYHPGVLKHYVNAIGFNLKFLISTPEGLFDGPSEEQGSHAIRHLIFISSENRSNVRHELNFNPNGPHHGLHNNVIGGGAIPITMTAGLRTLKNLALEKLPRGLERLGLVAHDKTGEELALSLLDEMRGLLFGWSSVGDQVVDGGLKMYCPNIKRVDLSLKVSMRWKEEERRVWERVEVEEMGRACGVEVVVSFTYGELLPPTSNCPISQSSLIG